MEPEWQVSPSVGFRMASGIGPRVALGGSIAVAGRPLASEWSFGVEVGYLKALTEEISGARADFRFILVRPNICPLALQLGNAGRLSLCAVAELGLVTASGTGIDLPESSDNLWVALEPALRLETPIERRWFFALEAGATLPITRYRFVFDNPRLPVHSVPSVLAAGRLGVGLRF
jgi:hypothetical protein